MEPLAKELTDLLSQSGMGTAGRVQGHSLKMQSCSEERPDANRTLQGPAAAAQLCFTEHEKSKKQTLGGAWTARTWISKWRYEAKEEVMKADFSSLGADTVFHGEADTKGAIRVEYMNLGGESITRPRRTSLFRVEAKRTFGTEKRQGLCFLCFLKWTSPAEDAEHYRRGSCRQSSPLQSVSRQLRLIPPVQTVWNFSSRDEVLEWHSSPAVNQDQ